MDELLVQYTNKIKNRYGVTFKKYISMFDNDFKVCVYTVCDQDGTYYFEYFDGTIADFKNNKLYKQLEKQFINELTEEISILEHHKVIIMGISKNRCYEGDENNDYRLIIRRDHLR